MTVLPPILHFPFRLIFNMKSLLSVLIFSPTFFFASDIKAQESGSSFNQNFEKKSVEDSTRNTKLKTKSPKGAMIRSLMFPGLGQFYNEQYIKAAIVLAGQGTLIGFTFYYNNRASKSTTPLEKEFYQDRRNLMYWWIGAATLLSMLDAYIDAHLYDFDTGPDLAIRIGALNDSFGADGVDFGFSLRAEF